MRVFFFSLLIISSISCVSNKHNVITKIIWVNSIKGSCGDVSPSSCLMVCDMETLDQTKWKAFMEPIEDFVFQSGYIYKLMIEKRKMNSAEMANSGSTHSYKLVKMIEKYRDKKLRLNDIWILESIGDTTMKPMQKNKPRLEFYLNKMHVNGNDGCNSIAGNISVLDDSRLEFGLLRGTMMACQDMNISNQFNNAISNTRYYQLKGLKLLLLDTDKKVILAFQKVD